MTASLESIVALLSIIAGTLGIAVSVWSAYRTRQFYYDNFLRKRQEQEEQKSDGD